MFNSRQKLAQASQTLLQTQRRTFQYFSEKTYLSGFDKMLLDKLNLVKPLNGTFFALFGVVNLMLYGASKIMTKEQYDYHFSYTGYVPRMFTPFKAMAASDVLSNVIWTAPALIGGNLYLLSKGISPLVMTKFFFLSLFSSFIFWSAFNPRSGLNFRPLHNKPFKMDAYADDGSYYRGADSVAQSLIYFALIYHRLWMVALPFMALDVLYYGPATLGGPAAGIVGAFMYL